MFIRIAITCTAISYNEVKSLTILLRCLLQSLFFTSRIAFEVSGIQGLLQEYLLPWKGILDVDFQEFDVKTGASVFLQLDTNHHVDTVAKELASGTQNTSQRMNVESELPPHRLVVLGQNNLVLRRSRPSTGLQIAERELS